MNQTTRKQVLEKRRRRYETAGAEHKRKLPVLGLSWLLQTSRNPKRSRSRLLIPTKKGQKAELGEDHAGALRRESGEAEAVRLVGQELKRLDWTEADLAARRKSDPLKLAIAARLPRETILSLKAIAARVLLEIHRCFILVHHEISRVTSQIDFLNHSLISCD